MHNFSQVSDPVVMAAFRNRLLIGATFDDDSAIAWFSNFGYHDVSTSLATLHEAMLNAINSSAIMKVYNYPLEANYNDDVSFYFYFHIYFHFLALVSRTSAALSSATQHAMPPEFGRKWGTECLNTRFPLPTLRCAGYSVCRIL